VATPARSSKFESIEWSMSDLPKVVSGGWIGVTIHNLKLYDDGGSKHEINDANRQLVLEIEKATFELDAHSLLFGHHDFVIKDVVITGKRGWTCATSRSRAPRSSSCSPAWI
jgi:hypothetical protein